MTNRCCKIFAKHFVCKLNFILLLIIACICAIAIFIGYMFYRKPSIQKTKLQSLARTKSAKYVQMLKSAGFKIYPIAGVEIGTIHDDDFNMVKDRVKKENDSFLHCIEYDKIIV